MVVTNDIALTNLQNNKNYTGSLYWNKSHGATGSRISRLEPEASQQTKVSDPHLSAYQYGQK
jgi:hypothetical protein